MNDMKYKLPADLTSAVDKTLADWQSGGKVKRLWSRDATLWTNDDEAKWLGWLDIVERQQKDIADFTSLADEITKAGFKYAVLLGMGGSSLCPEVLAKTFGDQKGHPELHILDSTDPAQVISVEKAVDLKKTIFIVSSKSGSTLEPNIFKDYFYGRMKDEVGDKAGEHFIAVTDPGSKMEQVAKDDKFRHIYYGDPSIGGRYSALSNFGIVPGAVMGLDVTRFLSLAQEAVVAAKNPDAAKNSGVMLGIILGTAAKMGRDKITFFHSDAIFDLGAWLEQLIAESTGKQGHGITPVDREDIGPPEVYGKDRVFAYVKLASESDRDLEKKVAALEAAGQPVVRFVIDDIYELGQQFFTWEIATAVAGSVIGINAFNQPDVEASKIETRKLTDEYQKTGKLTEAQPFFVDKDIKLFATPEYAATLKAAGGEGSLAKVLAAHLKQLHAGDYFAALAYVERDDEHQEILQKIRMHVRDEDHVATCLGFGPRFLHSTGQDYKGGPNTGVFLQVTADHAKDLAIPGAKYTFGVVIAAQAAGDLAVLQQRGRRALRAHVGEDVEAGLERIYDAIKSSK
jgi:glucose-6-phosphate isomerase